METISLSEQKILMESILNELHENNERIALELENNRRLEKALQLMMRTCYKEVKPKKVFRTRRVVSISIDADRCSGCGKCVENCSQHVLSMKPVSKQLRSLAVVESPNTCVGCLRCMAVCEFQAIDVTRFQ